MTHTTNPVLVLGVVAIIGTWGLVHLARRYGMMRVRVVPSEDISFTSAQRILHWTIGIGSAALFVTGLPIYLAQFLVSPSVPTPLLFSYWGFDVFVWRTTHIYLALIVVSLVVVHALWDVYRMKAFGRMRISGDDLREARARARDFLGFARGTEHRQPTTKYDFFHKAFHWTLLAIGAYLLVSGLLMWEALTWQGVPLFVWLDRFNHTFMDGFMRTGHLVAAMVFAGLVLVHFYFAVLPQNRPFLRAMTVGTGTKKTITITEDGGRPADS